MIANISRICETSQPNLLSGTVEMTPGSSETPSVWLTFSCPLHSGHSGQTYHNSAAIKPLMADTVKAACVPTLPVVIHTHVLTHNQGVTDVHGCALPSSADYGQIQSPLQNYTFDHMQQASKPQFHFTTGHLEFSCY